MRSTVSDGVWDRLRKKVYQQAGSRCEVCGGTGPRHPVEPHEMWEFDEANRVQRLVRMIALCLPATR